MAAMDADDKRGPGLKFPPPLLLVAVVGLAWWIEQWIPLPIETAGLPWRGGAALIALALVIALAALLQFFHAKTHVEPWQPTTRVIQSGLFRYSRNPIYLAFCIIAVGIGLLLNSWWILFSAVLLQVLLQLLVIRREEKYLELKFGEHYLDYKRRVRRWI